MEHAVIRMCKQNVTYNRTVIMTRAHSLHPKPIRIAPLKPILCEIQNPLYIEGGDIVFIDPVYFIGISQRTTLHGALAMKKAITKIKPDAQFVILNLINSDYYHLDTCFLPTNKFVIVAESIENLFDKSSVATIKELWNTKIIIAKEYSLNAWMLCNARRFTNCNNIGHTLVFSLRLPAELLKKIKEFDPYMSVMHTDIQEVLIGGGGISCSTLMDNTETIVLQTEPSLCNLTCYMLNSFQKCALDNIKSTDWWHMPTFLRYHREKLVDNSKNITKVINIASPSTRVYYLRSAEDVPESIFIKDVAVLVTDQRSNTWCIPTRFSVKERQNEQQWFFKELKKTS